MALKDPIYETNGLRHKETLEEASGDRQERNGLGVWC